MKRILPLLMALLMITGVVKAADVYTYSATQGDKISGHGVGKGGTNYSSAIYVPAEMASTMKGSTIDKVFIGFDSGVAKAITIFITKELGGTPIYTQKGNVKAARYNEFALTTPYVIDGEAFYIGYDYRQSTSSGNPIGFDGSTATSNENFDIIAVYSDGETPQYEHVGSQFGNLCLRAEISGANLPTNAVLPCGVTLPSHSLVGKEFTYNVMMLNMGTNPVNKVTLRHTVGSSVKEEESTLTSPLQPGESVTLSFKTSSQEEMMRLPVSVKILKVNGADNIWASTMSESYLANSNKVSQRVCVIEEYTGVECGYCPAGWVGLEYMRDNYTDGSYIGIAVHNYVGYSKDPMACDAYQSWVARWITGAPQGTVNRIGSIGKFSPSKGACIAAYNTVSGVIPISLKVEAWYPTEGVDTKLMTRSTVTMEGDVSNLNYGLAWVITEDNVGPYSQSNYYAGGKLGAMEGFENMGSSVMLMYNDVARNVFHWNGLQGSVPAQMQAGVPYAKDFEMPIYANTNNRHDNTNIIALLIDRSTGEIITGAKCKIGDEPMGINDVVLDTICAVEVKPAAGGINIEGNVKAADIYTLSGVRVASVATDGVVALPAGIYLVRAIDTDNNTVSAKIAVK